MSSNKQFCEKYTVEQFKRMQGANTIQPKYKNDGGIIATCGTKVVFLNQEKEAPAEDAYLEIALCHDTITPREFASYDKEHQAKIMKYAGTFVDKVDNDGKVVLNDKGYPVQEYNPNAEGFFFLIYEPGNQNSNNLSYAW